MLRSWYAENRSFNGRIAKAQSNLEDAKFLFNADVGDLCMADQVNKKEEVYLLGPNGQMPKHSGSDEGVIC